MMMRSFTTVIVILTATLSFATAFDNFMVLITREGFEEDECTDAVNQVIDQLIEDCVTASTGTTKHPTRKMEDRRRALTTTSAASRQLLCEPCACSLACIVLGFCTDTCGDPSPCNCARRLEEEFLAFDATESLRRELTSVEDETIKTHCKQEIKQYAHYANHNCLGDHNAIEVTVRTSTI
jgi:hypothetical protein